jgi:hypothetical protein
VLQLNQNVPLCLLHFQVPTGNLLRYPDFCYQFGLQNVRCLLPIHVLWSLVSIDQFYLRNIPHEGHMQIESNLSRTILPEIVQWDINCRGDYNVLFKNMNWLLRLGHIAWQLFMPMPICIWTTRLNILSWPLASHVNSVSLLLPNGPTIATWELADNLRHVHGPALCIIVTGCAKPTVCVHAHIWSLRYSS